MRKKSSGKSFRRINLCHTDDFGLKTDKIRLWVMNNGGTFSTELNDDVTHLICSKKAWKEYRDIVRNARRRRIKIVSLEWLEDSLLSSSKRPKPEKEYEWETVSKAQHAKQQAIQMSKDSAIKEAIADFDKQCMDFEATMQTSGYHPYTDPEGFCYSVLLVRTFLLENRLEKLTLKVRYPTEPSSRWCSTSYHPCPLPMFLFPASAGLSAYPVIRYEDRSPSNPPLRVPIPRPWAQCLQLYESDAIPHTYGCYVKYTRKGASGREVLAIPGSSWEVAFDAFRKFFKTKTRKDWNDRLDEKLAPASSDGDADHFFQYKPPKNPFQPRGLVQQKTRLDKAGRGQSGPDEGVTMIVPTIEISDDNAGDGGDRDINIPACTPSGMNW